MPQAPENYFSENKIRFLQEKESLQKKDKKISFYRIISFLLLFIAIIYAANLRDTLWVFMLVATLLIVFVILLIWHRKVRKALSISDALYQINEEELQKLSLQIAHFEDGASYITPDHPYAEDLDILGKSSLFQLLNRAVTPGGREKLADWLLHGFPHNQIKKQQKAVRSLSDNSGWQQSFQVAARLVNAQSELSSEAFHHWLAAPPIFSRPRTYYALSIFLPVLLFAAIAASYFLGMPAAIVTLFILVNIIVAGGFQKNASEKIHQLEKSIPSLSAYMALVEVAETLTPEQLAACELNRFTEKESISNKLSSLFKVIRWLENRSNFMYWFINTFLLMDIRIVLSAEQWKEKYNSLAPEWLEAIHKLEALNSLAGHAFANTDYTFPDPVTQPCLLSAKQLGHMLIKANARVCNDFTLSGEGQLTIITGSNMAGKSTFLRTLGINLVLARAGAPVCADNFAFSDLLLFTSMRTQDKLEESVSSFYAELQRIKQLLGLIKSQPRPVFFMLDEILKGTNSEDRHRGAAALVRQLNKTSAFGLISTHDLALGQIEKEDAKVNNFHFGSVIKGNDINFDYKIKPGICQSFNAGKLMQLMGIAIEDYEGK